MSSKWICENCKEINKRARFGKNRCKKCGVLKGEKPQEPEKEKEAVPPPSPGFQELAGALLNNQEVIYNKIVELESLINALPEIEEEPPKPTIPIEKKPKKRRGRPKK